MTVVPIAIVPMTRAHIDALMPYERDMFGTEAWSAASYRSELADRRSRYYVAAEGPAAEGPAAQAEDSPAAELLGWAGLLVVDSAAEILTVGVIPSARRQGVAGRLVAALLTEADRRGAVEVFLEVRVDNEAAIALYAREGFREVGRRKGYYANGRVDAVVMRRA